MADDIVAQLVELAATLERGHGKSTVYGAATEILRLRQQLEDCRGNRQRT